MLIGTPIRLPNGVDLRNRIAKSAMSEALADASNSPTKKLVQLYSIWSRSEAAVLITGNIQIDRQCLEHAANLVLDEKAPIEKFTEIACAAKSNGARIIAQLSHAGRQTPEAINPAPLSISSVALELQGYGVPKTASARNLADVVEKFAHAAQLAESAGFDGVQIHAAHGYLLSSSLSPKINDRTDHWGGSLENRARLLRSVLREIRARVSRSLIVAVKLNSADFQDGGFEHADSIRVAKLLQQEGIDFLEVSGGNFEAPVAYQYTGKNNSTRSRESYFLDYARDIKQALDIPVMVTGGFRSVKAMNDALGESATDLVGIARPFIIDPQFPARLLNGTLESAPAIERSFPPTSRLPRGAALNWFCHQLTLLGRNGKADLDLPIMKGHHEYLNCVESATRKLQGAGGPVG
jgi:2,4-dienoyl-CoA reductase-like NADH-dependent reductase (Old Yellow Enzyme family)